MIIANAIPECPTQLHLEITDTCNLGCGFCPVHRMKRGPALSPDKWISVIKQTGSFRESVGYIDFVNYNEPLLCKHIWLYATSVSMTLGPGKLGFVTNGTIMSEDIACRIASMTPKQVVFSVDAFTAETYSRVRPLASGEEDLGLRDRVYANIDTYLKAMERLGLRHPPVIQMTVCDANHHEVNAFRDYWSKKDVATVLTLNCTGRGGERSYGTPNNNPCSAILDGLWVLSDGQVVACCEDWNATDAVGNVLESSLMEIWNGDKIKRFRELHLSGRKCDIRVCKACHTSQDRQAHNVYPDATNPEVLRELGLS